MAVLLPNGKQQFVNGLGLPLVGGKVFTYLAGTNTPAPTWKDAAQAAANTNPIILDARGEATIFWLGTYKVVLADFLGNIIWTVDNITAAAVDTLLRSDLATDGAPLIAYKQPGSQGVTVTLANVLGNYELFPKLFGAVGDGVADDTIKIQAMMTRAAITGQSVRGDGGTYLCSAIAVTGAGTAIRKLNLVKKAGVDGILLKLQADGIIVDGCRLDGTNLQPTPGGFNDIIYIDRKNDCRIVNNVINGSAGGGISNYGGARNVIENNAIYNCRDNNIFCGEVNANANRIVGNVCIGTTAQNNIFVTASPASAPVPGVFIYDNLISGNYCRGSGDTGIESGIHTVRSIIIGNNCASSNAPAILVRDALYFIVANNVIEAQAGKLNDMIAVIPQTEPISWECNGIISDNVCIGPAPRSGIYVGQARVRVEGNLVSRVISGVIPAPDGSDLAGTGVLVANDVAFVDVISNRLRGWGAGVSFNFSGAIGTYPNGCTVRENEFEYIDVCVYYFGCVGSKGAVISNNHARAVKTGFLKGDNAQILPNGTYPTAQLRAFGNVLESGTTGASPYMYGPGVMPQDGLLADATSQIFVVPEIQYAGVTLGSAQDYGEGTMSVRFVPTPTIGASYAISLAGGNAQLLTGSGDMFGTAGAAGFAGWAAATAMGNWGLQRRGANTGVAGPRYGIVSYRAN